MASEVRKAFVDVLVSVVNHDILSIKRLTNKQEGREEAAWEKLRYLQATGRYQQDIWG